MKHTLKVTSGVMVDALISVFEKKGFIRIGQNVFKLTGYRPGPGVLKWDCEFDLEDYKEGEKADALIIFPADTSHVTVTLATWNGPEDGLPPVGLEVERRFPCVAGSSWLPGIVIAKGAKKVFFRDAVGDEWAHCIEDVEFRPARTAEQLAAEKRECGVHELMNWVKSQPVMEHRSPFPPVWSALYDAGLRAPVKP